MMARLIIVLFFLKAWDLIGVDLNIPPKKKNARHVNYYIKKKNKLNLIESEERKYDDSGRITHVDIFNKSKKLIKTKDFIYSNGNLNYYEILDVNLRKVSKFVKYLYNNDSLIGEITVTNNLMEENKYMFSNNSEVILTYFRGHMIAKKEKIKQGNKTMIYSTDYRGDTVFSKEIEYHFKDSIIRRYINSNGMDSSISYKFLKNDSQEIKIFYDDQSIISYSNKKYNQDGLILSNYTFEKPYNNQDFIICHKLSYEYLKDGEQVNIIEEKCLN